MSAGTETIRDVVLTQLHADRERLREDVECGVEAVRAWVHDKELGHQAAVKVAHRKGNRPPTNIIPIAGRVESVRACADKLADHIEPGFLPDDLIPADVRVEIELSELRDLPEFATFATHRVDVRWTRRPMTRNDLVLALPRAGQVKATPKADREAWTGEGPAPSFTLTLSLPWFLLATYEEKLRALHDLLSYCGVGYQEVPKLRKPSIVAHAATLGRFGVGDIREAQALLHAMRHRDIEDQLRRFECDPTTGQGLLWTTYGERG
jgi:hypothetical protein